MDMLLSDSTFCRLCAEENSNGVILYQEGEGEDNCSDLVNRYLPFKVSDDGKLPRTICPGCHIQLQATAQFFELLVEGQKKLRDMWKAQLDVQRKGRFTQSASGSLQTGESLLLPATEIDTNGLIDEESSIITIQILPDGALYTDSHPISLKIDGLDKPRRKRGRPPKVHPPEELAEVVEPLPEEQAEDEDEPEGDGRRRRKRKLPQRFMEAVAGKELERIFREEGVIDEEDATEEGDLDEDKEDRDGGLYIRSPQPGSMEVIGHLETDEGADLGEVTVMNKSRARLLKRRKNKFSCEICGKGFQHRGRYVLHKNGHKGVKFECSECNEVFSGRDSLLEHQSESGHAGEGIIEGVIGGADGADDIVDDSGVRIPCLHCDKTFQSKQSFEVHIKAIHEKQRPFKCNVCDKTFAYQNTLNFHMASHKSTKAGQEKGFPCDICGKVLNHPSSVVYHKEAEHNNGRRFVCNKCGKSFKHKQLLQRHQLVHSEDRPYTCKLCGATFKTNANLMNHQPTHTGEKKYFCEMCGQQFAHKTSLTLHYRWHTGQKPFVCVHCHKSFSQNGNLQEHLRIHTGEKPFCCETCGRKFTTSSQFKLHVKRHTGERPWKCEFCNKAFLHKDTWKCHTRRHKGERPFMCEYCKRGFTEQWALRKHMRLHTGEKPYSCNICGKNFSDCSNLTKHRRVHRNDPKNTTEIDPSVWNLIQAQIAKQEGSDVDNGVDVEHAVEMMTQANDGRRKVIYVTYQDPNDPTHSQTLQIVDDIMPDDEMEGQDELKAMGMDCELGEPTSPGDGQVIDIDPSVNIDPQSLQVTDEDGNPIHFTMQDGRELQVSINTADGQSLQVTTLDGHTIPLRLINNDGHVQPMVDRSMMAIEDEVDDGLAGGEHSIEYTTEDGQKLRLVTSYDVGQITSEFLDQT